MPKKNILTVKNIRNTNTQNILNSIVRNRSMTKSELSEENNISLMTVKHIADNLVSAGLLVENESVGTDVGRKPKALGIHPRYGNIVCVNLTSKDSISFIIYDIYNVVLQKKTVMILGGDYRVSLENVLDKIQNELERLKTETVWAVAFVPSAYNEESDCLNYDLVPGFRDLHIRKLFKKCFGTENITVVHDVCAAAWSEYNALPKKNESQFYFYCGYGIGGFFIDDGVAVTGSGNVAGEIGKFLIPTDISCQSYATLEELASISAITKQLPDVAQEMDVDLFFKKYLEGDIGARHILEPVLNVISMTLYNLIWVYNPDNIVIDSCVDKYASAICQHFTSYLKEMQSDAIQVHAEIRKAECDEYHTMNGCFDMARSRWIFTVSEYL